MSPLGVIEASRDPLPGTAVPVGARKNTDVTLLQSPDSVPWYRYRKAHHYPTTTASPTHHFSVPKAAETCASVSLNDSNWRMHRLPAHSDGALSRLPVPFKRPRQSTAVVNPSRRCSGTFPDRFRCPCHLKRGRRHPALSLRHGAAACHVYKSSADVSAGHSHADVSRRFRPR
jgi:hypothetical protein